MTVKKETKLFAQYEDHNYGRGQTVEVSTLEDAVATGTLKGSPRFKTFEKTFAEIDGEVLEGQPKNHSPQIYLNVDRVYTRDEVIAKHEQELEGSMTAPQWVSAQFSHTMHVQAIQSVIKNLEAKDPETRFIAEGRQRGDFIQINEGEKVFDRTGQQITWANDPDFLVIEGTIIDEPEV